MNEDVDRAPNSPRKWTATWRFDARGCWLCIDPAVPGLDANHRHALSRCLRSLLQDGRPFDRLALLFFTPPTGGGALRWLGALARSERGLVSFFPATVESVDQVVAYQGQVRRHDRAFAFDHITLDPRKTGSHLTSDPASARTSHFGAFPAHQLDEQRRLWLGYSLRSIDDLPMVLSNTFVEAEMPGTDAERRWRELVSVRHGVEFPAVALNEDEPPLAAPTYLHFGFIVGPRGCQIEASDEVGLPHGSPMLLAATPAAGTRFRVAARIHRVELGSDLDVLIVATEQPGRLNTSVHFTMPGPPPDAGAGR